MASEMDATPRRLKAKSLFEHGNEAALKSNFDYAIQMYLDACKLVPEELTYRQALRGVERRKFANDPAKVGRLVGARTQPIRLRAKMESGRKNWANAIHLCEETFVYNPWDTSASLLAAEAAAQLGLPTLAMFFIEAVFPQGQDDVGFLREAAEVFELNQQWQKAIHCWERVKKAAPSDEHAARKINALSASATITRSGLGDAVSRRQQEVQEPEGPDPAVEAEVLKRAAMTPEQRWQKSIQDDPTNIHPYLEWSEALTARGRLDDAEKILARGLKTLADDPSLLHAHAEIQMARLKRAIEAWTRRSTENPADPEAKAKLKQLREMLRDYEIKEVRRRVARESEDVRLRLQLGELLAKAGKHDEAIAEFQFARNDPAVRVRALIALANSFQANGVTKLAERSLQDALKEVEPDDQATLKILHYRLGRIAESTENYKKAEDHYNEVAAIDYTYEDVAQRLRGLAAKSDD